jgi:ABC-type transport system involved in cytochrome c biogenesis permease subunit
MATHTGFESPLTKSLPDYDSQPTASGPRASSAWDTVVGILTPLASLKLTVVLFLLALGIVFFGTLAQAEQDIWQVTNHYFRMDLTSFRAALGSAMAWIDLRILFPPAFFPNMPRIPWGYGFFFPSGWLIGIALFLNLTAAHLIRFRVQGRGTALAAGLVLMGLGVLLTIAVVAAGSQQTAMELQLFTDWPSLRILWLLTLCTAVSLTLLAASALIFHRRAGIVVLHAGVGLMMVGELIVGTSAVEGQMHIVEGQTVNYVMDSRKTELAIVDPSDPREDAVVAIPQTLLQKSLRNGTAIQDPALPFDAEVVDLQVNSRRQLAGTAATNPATAGIGLQQVAVPADPVSGTSTSGEANQPAVYVRVLKKGTNEALGVYLFGLQDWFAGKAEKVPVDGKTYDVSLRYKHTYKPYSMHLIDVNQDVYMGTQTPKSYSSELRLVDPTRHTDRKVKIWMNNPLRFAGETFYQSNYGRDQRTGLEYTGLQVVTNTGWRIPYVSCTMMAWGMLAQFGITLWRYVTRRRWGVGPDAAGFDAADFRTADFGTAGNGARGDLEAQSLWQAAGNMPAAAFRGGLAGSASKADWIVPLAVTLLCTLWLLSRAYIPKPNVGQVDLDTFGRLPVMFEGRIKPMDTLARNSLRIVSDRQTFRDENDTQQPAIRWALDVITDSPAAVKHRVFRIQNLEVLDMLGLERRSGFRYAIEEFLPKLDVFGQQVQQARLTDAKQQSVYQKKILELQDRISHYVLLIESFRPAPLRAENLSEDLAREQNRREQHSGGSLPLAVPPRELKGEWQPYSFAEFDGRAQAMAAAQGIHVAPSNPAVDAWTKILRAYGDKSSDAAAFNRSVQDYWTLLRAAPPQEWTPTKTSFETDFNHFAPFYCAMILYMGAFLLGWLSWLGWNVPLRRAALWLTLLTLAAHTLAIAARIYISGRPPITSLYSSTLFVGWFGVVLAILLEFYSPLGIANVVGAFLGFATLLISVLLTTAVPSFKGDSFTVLVAVLDTQFWLATHVTCVTAGYSATLLAGLLGIMYVLRGLLTPSQTSGVAQETTRMIYGTLCFAIFFSFFGTVLGGLWADDSWGRFWGWDPKENGALIIVLWNAVVLHAYWGRMVRERGLAVLSIVGNIVTAWSWFGVNELGIGLHTYGFTEGVLLVLGLVVAAHLIIIAMGLTPERFWRSTRTNRITALGAP